MWYKIFKTTSTIFGSENVYNIISKLQTIIYKLHRLQSRVNTKAIKILGINSISDINFYDMIFYKYILTGYMYQTSSGHVGYFYTAFLKNSRLFVNTSVQLIFCMYSLLTCLNVR